MRKADYPVREVVCSETGKPMPKIPLWMADIKVKFISDEARQKHPAIPTLAELEPLRGSAAAEELKDLDIVDDADDDEAMDDLDDDEPEPEEIE